MLILVLIGLICLAFNSTRFIGVSGLALAAVLHPWWFFMALLLAGLAYYFFRVRLKYFAYPKLPRRR